MIISACQASQKVNYHLNTILRKIKGSSLPISISHFLPLSPVLNDTQVVIRDGESERLGGERDREREEFKMKLYSHLRMLATIETEIINTPLLYFRCWGSFNRVVLHGDHHDGATLGGGGLGTGANTRNKLSLSLSPCLLFNTRLGCPF